MADGQIGRIGEPAVNHAVRVPRQDTEHVTARLLNLVDSSVMVNDGRRLIAWKVFAQLTEVGLIGDLGHRVQQVVVEELKKELVHAMNRNSGANRAQDQILIPESAVRIYVLQMECFSSGPNGVLAVRLVAREQEVEPESVFHRRMEDCPVWVLHKTVKPVPQLYVQLMANGVYGLCGHNALRHATEESGRDKELAHNPKMEVTLVRVLTVKKMHVMKMYHVP